MLKTSLTSLIFLCCWLYSFHNMANTPVEINAQQLATIEKLNHFFNSNKARLPAKEVITLAQKVIEKRQYYSDADLAKAFILLANVAANKGDMANVLQFAQDGLSLAIVDDNLKLNLLNKLAQANYAKSNFIAINQTVEQMLNLAKNEDFILYQLYALSYRAIVAALLVEPSKARNDLQYIEQLLNIYKQYANDIELLDLLALAHYYLDDFEATISIQLRLLNLRFKQSNLDNIGKNYYTLANAYFQLNRLDDAYNIFWEERNNAELIKSPIRKAYAQLGLGQVFYAQQKYSQALTELALAEKLFKGSNLTQAYLSCLIFLAKTHLALNQKEQAYQILVNAELFSEKVKLTYEQIELTHMLAQMYYDKGEINQAWTLINQYLTTYQKHRSAAQTFFSSINNNKLGQKNMKTALSLALRGEIYEEFSEKVADSTQLNTIFIFIISILSVVIILLTLRLKEKTNQHEIIEKPLYLLAQGSQTKLIYQKAFKMARKYQYPLSVAYLIIHNWHELVFNCNKKELEEVKRTIATVINEYINEYDTAGLLNQGEYILLFPHQTTEQVNKLVNALTEALKVRFFANLGETIVNINYSLECVAIQDIDPFIFLSRLTEQSKNKVPDLYDND